MSLENRYNSIKNDIASVRNRIIEVIEPTSVEYGLFKGYSAWLSELTYEPSYLFIGFNLETNFYRGRAIKYKVKDLDSSDVSKCYEYRVVFAKDTKVVFKKANKFTDLKKSVKIGINLLVTSNQKDLFHLEGILQDKYNINIPVKTQEWITQLIELIDPKCIICEGAYPARKIAEYFDVELVWQNDLCKYTIGSKTSVIGYKRIFSKIINKNGLVELVRKH